MHTKSDRGMQALHKLYGRGLESDFFGVYRRLKRGIHGDFRGLREYVVGDSLRHVDRKSTARSGSLHTKEFDDQQGLEMHVVLDEALDTQQHEYAKHILYCLGTASCRSHDSLKVTHSGGKSRIDSLGALYSCIHSLNMQRHWLEELRYIMLGQPNQSSYDVSGGGSGKLLIFVQGVESHESNKDISSGWQGKVLTLVLHHPQEGGISPNGYPYIQWPGKGSTQLAGLQGMHESRNILHCRLDKTFPSQLVSALATVS